MNVRVPKLLKLARGQPCMLKAPGCNGNPETTVWAHLNSQRWGKGMGIKGHDPAGFCACNSCHDLYDGRQRWSETVREEIERDAERAVIDTYIHLFREGLIKVA